MRGEQCGVRKILHTVIQRFGERFDERAAAGGTCFIELYAVNGLVLNLDTFHILSADVQYTVHFRVEESGGLIVRDGFHFAVIQ